MTEVGLAEGFALGPQWPFGCGLQRGDPHEIGRWKDVEGRRSNRQLLKSQQLDTVRGVHVKTAEGGCVEVKSRGQCFFRVWQVEQLKETAAPMESSDEQSLQEAPTVKRQTFEILDLETAVTEKERTAGVMRLSVYKGSSDVRIDPALADDSEKQRCVSRSLNGACLCIFDSAGIRWFGTRR